MRQRSIIAGVRNGTRAAAARRLRPGLAALALSLFAFACGGPKQVAEAPEANPWAEYKGTFAAGVPETTPETKAASIAPPKPAMVAEAKPKSAAAPAPPSTVEPKPSAASDARAMYDMPTDSTTEEVTAEPAPKKTPKKRGGAGKKAGGKKAPRPRGKQ